MSTGCQKDRKTETQADRQTGRLTERQIEDKTTFQLSYHNKSCSECQQDVRKTERHGDLLQQVGGIWGPVEDSVTSDGGGG